MNMKAHEDQFRPSTYCANVSEPLLERINELETELRALKKQIRTLKLEKASRQQDNRIMTPSWFNDHKRDRTGLID